MGIGPGWSVGDLGDYEIAAAAMNDCLRWERSQLEAFKVLLTQSATGLMEAQDTTLFTIDPKPPRYDSAKIAKNWFGIGGPPVWAGPCDATPVEIHQVMRAARARLADFLLRGALKCRILGSCGFEKVEVWITWPPEGFVGQTVTMWVFAPHTQASWLEYVAQEERGGEPGVWNGNVPPASTWDNPAQPGPGKVAHARLTHGREPGLGQLAPASMESPIGREAAGEVWFWSGPKREGPKGTAGTS
jgi:hypothetical protein